VRAEHCIFEMASATRQEGRTNNERKGKEKEFTETPYPSCLFLLISLHPHTFGRGKGTKKKGIVGEDEKRIARTPIGLSSALVRRSDEGCEVVSEKGSSQPAASRSSANSTYLDKKGRGGKTRKKEKYHGSSAVIGRRESHPLTRVLEGDPKGGRKERQKEGS